MFSVTREITFCYGHRLLRYEGKCRHLHGHNGVLEVDVDTSTLDSLGMVVDFFEVVVLEVFRDLALAELALASGLGDEWHVRVFGARVA